MAVTRPSEQAGFHTWLETGGRIIGDSQKLKNIPDDKLIDEAKRIADKADFLEGNNWNALCGDDPNRALRALDAQASRAIYPVSAWNSFLWAATKLDCSAMIAALLLRFPSDDLPQVANAASWWLKENADSLAETYLWPLWDKLESAAHQISEAGDG